MTITTNASITCPDYLLSEKPTSVGDLLRATVDADQVTGLQLYILLLLIAEGDLADRGGRNVLSATVDYFDLWATIRTDRPELDDALVGLQRQFGNRGFFLLSRNGDNVDLYFDTKFIWAAARAAKSKLMAFDVPGPEWPWEE